MPIRYNSQTRTIRKTNSQNSLLNSLSFKIFNRTSNHPQRHQTLKYHV